MSVFACWLLVWTILLWLIGLFRGELLFRPWAKIVFLPGVLVDACLKAVACLVTQAPIRGLHPLRPDRPFLETGKSPFRYLGPPLSVAVRLVLLFTAAHWLIAGHTELSAAQVALPEPASLLAGDEVVGALNTYGASLGALPTVVRNHPGRTALVLYVLLATAFALAFDHRELGGALGVWLTLVLLVSLADWLGLRFGWFSRGWFIRWLYGGDLWSTFSLLITATAGACGLLGVGRLIFSMVRSTPTK